MDLEAAVGSLGVESRGWVGGTGGLQPASPRAVAVATPADQSLGLRVVCGTSAWISVSGELDLTSAPFLRRAIAVATELPGRSVIVDLAELDFVDIAGLAAFDGAAAACRALGKRLRVRRAPPVARTLLQLSGLADTIEVDGAL